MSLAIRLVAGVILAVSSAGIFAAQSVRRDTATKPAEISFQFERPGLPVPRFTLRIGEDGTGTYEAEEMEGVADRGTVHYASGKHIERTINLTPETVATIFRTARSLDRFTIDCGSKRKNIADTGKKILSYTGEDGAGSCVYNYSDNKKVTTLTDTFLAIANTMDEGRKLEYLHRYDRLGLDAEMSSLQEQVEAGRALELGTIAPVLTSIAQDMAVMERVRSRAARLLESGKGKI